jgi:eukaryotic-like serine/threonine-protein kinase
MEAEHWGKIDGLYHSALEQEPSQRALFLEQACCGDESLLRELRSLLEQSQSTDFLESPALEIAAQALAKSPTAGGIGSAAAASVPATIGRYRILRLLGEGGMGVVYEAEQEQPRRIVALKVTRPGLATPERLWRFRHECQALGRLQHPGIAQIYEAGTAETGFGPQPYFAMEFIRGLPLGLYAKSRSLNTRQRLALMVQICDAVHHAHQRGLIHRDLKPGNILVDETGQPKILDFGVARATGGDAQPTHQTDLGQLVGTLAYMSPEQLLGDPLQVDTRSDVYSLGVILYELLAGRPPYEVNSRQVPEAVRMIREEDPAALSSLSPNYRGDIETIAGRALEKDKARRYASAGELAADIQRYLSDEPITARPPSATYQLQKFARRHRALVAGMAAVFFVLVGGVAVSTSEAIRAKRAGEAALRERDRTVQAEATEKAISDFLQNDLLAQASAATQSGPSAKPDPDLKVRTALDRAAARIAGKFDRQPEVEAAIRDTIGETYMNLGLYPEARTQLERALDLHRRALGAENPKTLQTISRLGYTAYFQGKYAEAEALLGRTLEIQRRVLGSQHPDTVKSLHNLALVYEGQGKYAQAEVLDSQTLEMQRRVLGPEHPDTLASMNNLAIVYRLQGKYAQAEALLSQTLEIIRRVLGPEHPNTLSSMFNLAGVYEDQGKYAQAEALDSQTLEIRRRVLGPEHPNTLSCMHNLASVYYEHGDYAQAEALDSQTLELRRRVLGSEHPDTLGSMNNLADDYVARGKYVQAEALQSQTLELKRRVLGPEHPMTVGSICGLADVNAAQGKYAQAEALFRQTLEIQRRVSGPEHPNTLNTLSRVTFLYQRQGKYPLAETYAAQALAGRRHAMGSEHPDTMASATDLALTYVSQGKFAASEPLAREALEFDRKRQPDDWQRFRTESLLGASLAGEKKYAEAEPLLLEGYQGMLARKDRIGVPDRYHLELAHQWLVQLYQAWSKPEKAAEWSKT